MVEFESKAAINLLQELFDQTWRELRVGHGIPREPLQSLRNEVARLVIVAHSDGRSSDEVKQHVLKRLRYKLSPSSDRGNPLSPPRRGMA
jgi:hypothetical protein